MWLPAGQALSFALSTATFAVLARVLGPTPFAQFAVIVFVFTGAALISDLTPLGFLIVNGRSAETLRAARSTALISSFTGVIIVILASLAIKSVFPAGFISGFDAALLCAALTAQMVVQTSRSYLVVGKRYAAMAIVDAATLSVGLAVAVATSFISPSATALTLQLATTAILRAAVTPLVARSLGSRRQDPAEDSSPRELFDTSFRSAFAYGIRIIPLNLATYLGRSLDSALLPAILPTASAAAYARSYQLIIVPITQLQMAFGTSILNRFSRSHEALGRHDRQFSKRLWNIVEAVATVSALLIGLSSTVIQDVLFGSRWPLVNVTLCAMACLLPPLATATHYSWTLQVDGKLRDTFRHLLTLTATPIAVVVAAAVGNTQAAIVTLVVSSLVQPFLLAYIHPDRRPYGLSRTLVRASLTWTLLAAVFAISAQLSGFWTYDFD